MSSVRILTSLYLAVVIQCFLALGAIATDVTEGGVTMLFKSVTPTTWSNNNRTQLFKTALSVVANGYCSRKMAKCSLNSWNITRTFEPGNIVIVSGFPQTIGADLGVKFYITYPSGQDISGNSKRVLPASTVKDIILANRENISNVVGESMKSVGEDNAGKDGDDEKMGKTNKLLNYIMIPLSVLVLIILSVVTCCLQHCKNKHVRALEVQRKQQLEMKNQSKPQTTQVGEEVVSKAGRHRKRRVKKKKKKKEKRDEELGSSDDAPEKPKRANGMTVWFEDEEQLSSRGKMEKQNQRKHGGLEDQQPEKLGEGVNMNSSRQHRDFDGHHSETREDLETDEVDTDHLQKRKKKKKKKERKRYVHINNEGSGASEQRQAGLTGMPNSQLGKLPGIRNLPPLKEKQSVQA